MREKSMGKLLTSLVMLFMIVSGCGILAGQSAKAEYQASTFGYHTASELRKQGKLKASKTSIKIQEDEAAGGMMISGKASDFGSTVFTYGESLKFEKNQIPYFFVDALAQRRKKISLAFYLDKEKKPFATVALAKQKKEGIWSTVRNRCVNLSGKKISGNHTLRFRVVTEETGNLQFVLRSVSIINSDIPTVEFDLDESEGTVAEMNGDSEHDTECYGKVSLNIPKNYKSEYSNKTLESATYNLDYIRGRGNSTWSVDKKPYKFKLEKKQDLLGMGSNKHWVLLANYYDVSMLRNKLTYWLGTKLGMEFTPQCEFVNVVMNGQYLGSYYLSEHVRVGDSRVDIDDLEKDEETKAATDEDTISGGYLLSMSPYGDETKKTIRTTRENEFLIESPSFEGYTNETQFNYIRDYVQKTEDAIYGTNFKDEKGIGYEQYMDVDAAIDYYWIQELSMNGDGFISTSTYLYKKRNGKLFWGPLWDFDFVAWGATEYYGNSCEGYTQNDRTWFRRLFQDPAFCKKVMDRWPTIREKLLEACKDGGQIDKYSKKQYNSQKVNYQIWKKYSEDNEIDWTGADGSVPAGEITYDSEVERLKKWIQQRVEWIDGNLNSLQKEYRTVSFEVDGTSVLSLQVEKDTGIGEFPSSPEKEGYIFKGWYTKDGDKEQEVTEETIVANDITVYAKWEAQSEAKQIQQITFEKDEFYLLWDDMLELPYGILPFDAVANGIVWSSSNEGVATVSEGVVHPKGQTHLGSTTILATAPNGVVAGCVVHVVDYKDYQPIDDFSIGQSTLTIPKGGYEHLQVQCTPKDAVVYRMVDYISSDESIVKTGGSGYLYGVKEGNAVVVVLIEGLKPKICNVTVEDTGTEGGMPSPQPVPTPIVDPLASAAPSGSVNPSGEPTDSPDITPAPAKTPVPIIMEQETAAPTKKPSAKPTAKPSAKPTAKPSAKPTAKPSATPKPIPTPKPLKKGDKFSFGKLNYQVLSPQKKTVSCIGVKNAAQRQTEIVIPAKATYRKTSYRVTVVAKKAFFSHQSLTKVTVGKNVTKIASQAFAGCKQLKEIHIETTKLKKVGKKVVYNTANELRIIVPKGKGEEYNRLFTQ